MKWTSSTDKPDKEAVRVKDVEVLRPPSTTDWQKNAGIIKADEHDINHVDVEVSQCPPLRRRARSNALLTLVAVAGVLSVAFITISIVVFTYNARHHVKHDGKTLPHGGGGRREKWSETSRAWWAELTWLLLTADHGNTTTSEDQGPRITSPAAAAAPLAAANSPDSPGSPDSPNSPDSTSSSNHPDSDADDHDSHTQFSMSKSRGVVQVDTLSGGEASQASPGS